MSAPGSDTAVSLRAALTARFTAPGAEFEVVEQMVRGIPMRVFSGGPQTLREVLLGSAAFGDRTFLVYGTERWTFAEHLRQVAGIARCLTGEYGLRMGDRVAVRCATTRSGRRSSTRPRRWGWSWCR
jgi:long-chain acyl-CoA synthetase